MTTPTTEAGLTPQEMIELKKKLDQSAELAQEIREQRAKLSPQQFEELQARQLARMPAEQRALAEQFQKQIEQQLAAQATPAAFFGSFLQEAFQSVAEKVAQNPDLPLAERIAVAQLAAEGAKGYNALLEAKVKETQLDALQSEAAKSLKAGDNFPKGQYL